MPSTQIRDALISYARAGLAVFPLHGILPDGTCSCTPPGEPCRLGEKQTGKHPATKRGLQDASTSLDQIMAWIAEADGAPRNIGMLVPEGVAVVDIDPRHGGDETWRRLETKHGQVPPTLAQKTGGGGAHLWYRLQPGTRLPVMIGRDVADDRKQTGIDIRNGLRSYVVVAPSSHRSGGSYEWVDAKAQPAEAPPWLKAQAFVPEEREELPAEELSADPVFTLEEHARIAAELRPYWEDGQKHSLAKALGGWLRQRGASLADLKAVMDQLPSNEPRQRLAAAVACYRAATTNGWGALQDILGEEVAVSLDIATPNPVREAATAGSVDWGEVWGSVAIPLTPSRNDWAQPQPVDLTDPYCGLPHPIEPDETLASLPRIVEGLPIVPSMATALIARPHGAKTPFALALGLCVSAGIPFLGRATKARRVIYCCHEKPVMADRKRVRMARVLGVNPRGLELLDLSRIALTDAGVIDRVAAVAAQGPALVIVDTYNAAVSGVDHNSPDFAAPLRRLVGLVCGNGGSVLVLCHCRKGELPPTLQDLGGHTALAGVFDAAIATHRSDPEHQTQIDVLCARAIEDGFAPFTIDFSDVPTPGESLAERIAARPDWGLAVTPVNREQAPPEPAPVRQSPGEQAVERTRHAITAVLQGRLAQQLTGQTEGELAGATGATRAHVTAAVKQLVADGIIRRHRDGGVITYTLQRQFQPERKF